MERTYPEALAYFQNIFNIAYEGRWTGSSVGSSMGCEMTASEERFEFLPKLFNLLCQTVILFKPPSQMNALLWCSQGGDGIG